MGRIAEIQLCREGCDLRVQYPGVWGRAVGGLLRRTGGVREEPDRVGLCKCGNHYYQPQRT